VLGVGEQSRQLESAQVMVNNTRTEVAGLTVELRAARGEIHAEQQCSTGRLTEQKTSYEERLTEQKTSYTERLGDLRGQRH
jgi:hypothetical protein